MEVEGTTDVEGTDAKGTDVKGSDVKGTDVESTDDVVEETAIKFKAENCHNIFLLVLCVRFVPVVYQCCFSE